MKIKHFNTKIFIRISLLITTFMLLFSFVVLRAVFNNYKSSLYNNFKNEFIAQVNEVDVILEIVGGEAKYTIAYIERILSDNKNELSEENIKKIESNIEDRLKNTKHFDSVSYIYLGDSFDDWRANWFVKSDELTIKEEGPYDSGFVKTYFDNTTEYDIIKSNSDIDSVWNYVSEETLDANILGTEFNTAVVSNIHTLRDEHGNSKLYITCDVSGRQLQEIMKNINFNTYGEVRLLDENNQVLVKSGESGFDTNMSKSHFSETNSEEIMQSGEFYFILKPLANGWKVFFVANGKDLFESYYDLLKLVMFFIVVFIVTSFVMSYVLGKNIAKPVNLLADDVGKFNSKEAIVTIGPQYLNFSDEIGTLANALKDMQGRIVGDFSIIQNNNINLERVVEEKTEELIKANKLLQNMLDKSNAQKTELIMLNVQLEDSIHKVKITQDSLLESRKMEALSTLVVGVAHEINTPIGTCYTSVTYLKTVVFDFNKKYENEILTKTDVANFINVLNDIIDLITSSTTKAIELVENFKKLSNSDNDLTRQRFKVKTLLKYLIEGIGQRLDDEINIQCDENLEFKSYPLVFSQIFNNLITNAIQHGYTKNGKVKIDIIVKAEDDHLVITLSDYGQGMAEQTSEKIFDPFFTTKRGNGNVGLGLTITYNLVVSKLKGAIKIYSKLNKGTTCEIKLPFADTKEWKQ